MVNREDIAVLGWRLLEIASLSAKVLEALWASLMTNQATVEAARIAFNDPVALRSFEKAPFDIASLRGGRDSAAAIFQYGGAAFIEILLRRLDVEHRPTIAMRALALLKGNDVEYLWEKYANLADDFKPLERDLERAQFYNYTIEPNARAWDFLARSEAGASILRPMWRKIFRMAQWSELSGCLYPCLCARIIASRRISCCRIG